MPLQDHMSSTLVEVDYFFKPGFKDKILKLILVVIKVRISLASSSMVPNRHVLASYALSSSDMNSLDSAKSFNSDSQTCVCDNSANNHIWNNIKDFIPPTLVKLSVSASSSVVTIGGSDLHPTYIGDVKVTWSDNEDVPHNIMLKDVILSKFSY